MTETQRRIQAYKKALPHMKERVMAVALLFVISISMMVSASFAWITLSRAPEVNGLATTIATNGNLEIALSDKDGLEPDPTSTTDGSGDITQTNLKWGNLVNLSHASYGLDKIVLRPATLNSGSLLKEPLYSVKYNADGRISGIISDFAYTNYGTKDGAEAFFVPEDGTEYGVRAISSVTYSSVTGDAALLSLNTAVKEKYSAADNAFKTLWGNKEYMNSITGLAGVYLQYRIDDTDQDCSSYVKIVYEMMTAYKDCLYKTGESLVANANVYHFLYCNQNNKTYTAFTMEDLHNGTIKSTLASESVTLEGLDAYMADHVTFNGTEAKAYADGLYSRYYTNVYDPWTKNTSIGWELMRGYINVMADINSATINGTKASALGASDLMSLVFAQNKICELNSGLVWNMDWFYGGEISVSGVKVKAMGQEVELTEIRTSVKTVVADPTNTKYTNYPIIESSNNAKAKAEQGGLAATDAVAADTYGMVIDFWLRTNAANSLLGLAGKVDTEIRTVTDASGNPVKDDNGNTLTETVVTGYSGVNRIWEEDNPGLPVLGESTSQGSGSCYIFYPETPEDQAQALQVLSAMRVAFVDEEGTLLAQADMDTSMAFEDMGRVLVPLQLRAKSIVTGTDEEGNDIVENAYFITQLTQNEATRITAIVYIDGSVIDNSSVLSAGSIKGQLNIQFGTTEDITSVDDPIVSDFYSIILSADKTKFDSFDPNNKPKVKLTLTLNGMEANNIKGQFVSYISATQGANQPEFEFVKGEGSTWTADVTFNGPGNFKLRNIRINGVDYPLEESNVITVEIPGLTVESLTCNGWDGASSKKVMTADSYYQLASTLTLKTSTGMTASKVQGVFAHDGGQNVTVDYVQTNNGWVATTNFTTSGKYTMTYVIIDGSYVPLDADMHKSLELFLGLKTQVFLSLPMTEAYAESLELIENKIAAETAEYKTANPNATEEEIAAAITAINEKYADEKQALYDAEYGKEGKFPMTATSTGYTITYDASEPLFMDVSCTITDDKGNLMTNLSDVVLHYGIGASVVNRLDSNMTWNAYSERYEGEFTLNRPGAYSFQNLEIGTGENKSIIYSATAAPKLTAISPVPMEYVGAKINGVDINPGSVTDIGATYREMAVALKNAESASVLFEIKNEDEGDKVYTFNGSSIGTDEATGITKFVPVILNENGGVGSSGLPHDGKWTIKGMKVANVFYNGTYYDGDTETDGATGWLDLGEFLENDEGNLTTDFFTTVKFSVENQPGTLLDGILSPNYYGAFMVDHKVENMTITITDYFNNAIEGAEVNLTYKWDSSTNGVFTVPSGTTLPNTEFSATKSNDGKTFAMPEVMNFQLHGTYKCTFEIKIGDDTYDLSRFEVQGGNTFTANDIRVTWTLPDVKITAVTDATKDSISNPTFSVNLGDYTYAWNELSGVQNYFEDYYANVYISAKSNTEYSCPNITTKISNFGKANSASFVVMNGEKRQDNSTEYDREYTFIKEGEESTQQIGAAGTGWAIVTYGWAESALHQTVDSIKMVYDNVTYTVNLAHDVIINQQHSPLYLTLDVDTTNVDMPNTISATDSKGNAFTVSTGGTSPAYVISPDGRQFNVSLPNITKSVNRTVDSYSEADYSGNENGTAKGEYINYEYTKQELNGCGYDNVTYYDIYQKYERIGTVSGTRTIYTDTYTAVNWKVGEFSVTSGASVSISSTTTSIANITLNTVIKEQSELSGSTVVQYMYKDVSKEQKYKNGNVVVTDKADIVTEWTLVE